MTDKEKIRAEIERIKETHERNLDKPMERGRIGHAHGYVDCCDEILSFIDSLPEEPKIDAPYEIRVDPANGFDWGSVNVYRDGNLVVQRPEQWKWIDPKYEYPLCLTREMDECGDWHYSLSSGKISDTCQYISLAELERLPDEPVDADAAMKELDEKIKLTKEHGSWEGVDVDKFMDEVRGRESDDLDKLMIEVQKYYSDNFDYVTSDQPTLSILTNIARHFTEWQKRKMMEGAVEGEVVKDISNKLAVTAKINLVGFKFGQKVKIIILKDDENIND